MEALRSISIMFICMPLGYMISSSLGKGNYEVSILSGIALIGFIGFLLISHKQVKDIFKKLKK